MGASMGVRGADSNDPFPTATIGGCVEINKEEYMLLSHHIFQDHDSQEWALQDQNGCTPVYSPSPLEAILMRKALHRVNAEPQKKRLCEEFLKRIPKDPNDYQIGVLVNSSGFGWVPMPGPTEDHKDDVMEMDWALCSLDMNNSFLSFRQRRPVVNRTPPFFQQDAGHSPEQRFRHTSDVVPNSDIFAIGRTSGFRRGYISLGKFINKLPSREFYNREWVVIDEDESKSCRIGAGGDSGSWIIDAETHVVYGQVWAEIESEPHQALFTPIEAIFDHIESKTDLGRPQLPLVDSIGSCKDWGRHDMASQVELDLASEDPKMFSEMSSNATNGLCPPLPARELRSNAEIMRQILDLESRELLYPAINPDISFLSRDRLEDELESLVGGAQHSDLRGKDCVNRLRSWASRVGFLGKKAQSRISKTCLYRRVNRKLGGYRRPRMDDNQGIPQTMHEMTTQ
jgi:hypothetical protein